MKTKFLFTGLMTGILAVLLTGCTKQPPIASFTVSKTDISAGESVKFTDRSINNPTSWEWEFEGGTPASSTSQNPTVTYNSSGVYSVSLFVSNDDGSDDVTRENCIYSTKAGTDITFHNTTHTDIDIEIDGDQRVIPEEDSVTYENLTGNSVDYYAYTSGKTSSGNQLGIKLVWDNTITLDQSEIERTLYIGPDYYFLYMTNNGTHVLTPIEIGRWYSTLPSYYVTDYSENIYLPTNGTKYSIAYYDTYVRDRFWIQIRAYYEDDPDSYTYWDDVTHFTMPGTDNQSISLSNSFKKSSVVVEGEDISGDRSTFLAPDYAIKPEDK